MHTDNSFVIIFDKAKQEQLRNQKNELLNITPIGFKGQYTFTECMPCARPWGRYWRHSKKHVQNSLTTSPEPCTLPPSSSLAPSSKPTRARCV